MSDFYSFRVKGIDGVGDLLAPLRGSVALVVNVASQCGYTPQYAGLERLYRELKGQRFTIIGFPCNQFGQQEPGAHRPPPGRQEQAGRSPRTTTRASLP